MFIRQDAFAKRRSKLEVCEGQAASMAGSFGLPHTTQSACHLCNDNALCPLMERHHCHDRGHVKVGAHRTLFKAIIEGILTMY